MSSIANILQTVAPPSQPCSVDFEWADLERHFQLDFPEDFKLLVSTYGRGVFMPSKIRLCGYLDGSSHLDRSDSPFDLFVQAAQRDPATFERVPFSFYPTAKGLLPFAKWASEDYFFWNPLKNPWSIVWIQQNGAGFEEIENISTSEFLLKALCLDPDLTQISMRDFLCRNNQLEVGSKTFRCEPHKPIVARGGGSNSYKIADWLAIRLPEELLLHSAEIDDISPAVYQVSWDWNSGSANTKLAPECTFTMRVHPASSRRLSLPDRISQTKTYFSSKGLLEEESFQSSFGSAIVLSVNEYPMAVECSVGFVVVLGQIETTLWELSFNVAQRYLSQMKEIARIAVNSLALYDKNP